VTSEIPDTLLLRPSRKRWLLLLVLCLAFTAGGVMAAARGEIVGWLGLIFFGLCSVVAVILLLPNSAYLRLTRDDFEVRSLFRSHRVRWTDVKAFRPGRIGFNAMVLYDFAPSYAASRRMRAISSAIGGAEGAVPDSYGLSVPDLARLLEEWRVRASHATG
jgi:hypothetical protein